MDWRLQHEAAGIRYPEVMRGEASGRTDRAPEVRPPIAANGESFSGRHVYMVGIGGCGMAGLARMLAARGAGVRGSDKEASDTTGALIAEGIPVGYDQSREWLPEGCDLVVASAAIKPDHPQIIEAHRRSIPVLTYAAALGRCMAGRTGVAIAGTHGKSTTTAMLGAALVDAGLDPTVIVGATCGQLQSGCLSGRITAESAENAEITAPPFSAISAVGTGFRMGADRIPAGAFRGQPGLLIAEACEYNRSFHNYAPRIASISSVEADHLDIYGSLDAVVEAFRGFARLVAPASEGGRLLIAHSGAHREAVTAGLACEVETIGFDPAADWVVSFDLESRRVGLSRHGRCIATWTTRLPGAHNAVNSATAAALGVMLGAEPGVLSRSLGAFRGVDRRCQLLGERAVEGGLVRVYDDYGHHPTEVEATLRALRQFERPEERGGRLICVFQPHQHSRTRHLLEEFAAAFASADVVIVPHIYFVRDSVAEKQSVSAADLVDRLRGRGVRAMHLYPFEAIVEELEDVCGPGDLLVVMGAGPVWQVAHEYMAGGARPRARAVIEPKEGAKALGVG